MRTRQIIVNIIFLLMIVSLYKCNGQANANFKTLTADTIKPRPSGLGGSNMLFLKKPDNIYVNVQSQNEDSTLRNWVKKQAGQSFDSSKYIPWKDTTTRVNTPFSTNFKKPVKYNNDTIFYLPVQGSGFFEGSMFVGNGGKNLSRVSGVNGQQNTCVGLDALTKITTGSQNTVIGSNSLISLTTGVRNTSIGANNLDSINTQGLNTTIGFGNFQKNKGSNNTGFGVNNALNSSGIGSFNIGVGNFSMFSLIDGSYNIGLGYRSVYNLTNGVNNIAIGDSAGFSQTTANKNIYVGHKAGYSNTTDSKLYIENSNSQTPLIGGKFDVDQLGINMPIGNTWTKTLNVGGGISFTEEIQRLTVNSPALTLSSNTSTNPIGFINLNIEGGSLDGLYINNNQNRSSQNLDLTGTSPIGIRIQNNSVSGTSLKLRSFNGVAKDVSFTNNLDIETSYILNGKYFMNDTTGGDNMVTTKKWVKDRLTGGGFPYTQTLTSPINWSGNQNINIGSTNADIFIGENVVTLDADDGVTSQSVGLTTSGLIYSDERTVQNNRWIPNKFYVDSVASTISTTANLPYYHWETSASITLSTFTSTLADSIIGLSLNAGTYLIMYNFNISTVGSTTTVMNQVDSWVTFKDSPTTNILAAQGQILVYPFSNVYTGLGDFSKTFYVTLASPQRVIVGCSYQNTPSLGNIQASNMVLTAIRINN